MTEVQHVQQAFSKLQQRRTRELHQRVASELGAVEPAISNAVQQIIEQQSNRSQQTVEQSQELVEQIKEDVAGTLQSDLKR